MSPVELEGLCEDELDQLADHFHAVSSHAHAHFLKVMGEKQRRASHRDDGCRSLAQWIQLRYGKMADTAGREAATVRRLRTLPHLAEAYGEGRACFDQVHHASRVADPETDEQVAAEVALRPALSWAQAAARARPPSDGDSQDAYERRFLDMRWRGQSLHGRFALPEDLGAEVKAVIDALAARQPKRPETGRRDPVPARRADALVELAQQQTDAEQRAGRPPAILALVGLPPHLIPPEILPTELRPDLAAPPSAGDEPPPPADQPSPQDEAPVTDADDEPAAPAGDPDPGGERVAPGPEAALAGWIVGGPVLSRRTLERLCRSWQVYEALLVGGKPLWLGRSRRFPTTALRQWILARDHYTCKVRACDGPARDIAHVRDFNRDGCKGHTDPDGAGGACGHHHRLVTEGSWRFVPANDGSGDWLLQTPGGTILGHDPPAALHHNLKAALDEALRIIRGEDLGDQADPEDDAAEDEENNRDPGG